MSDLKITAGMENNEKTTEKGFKTNVFQEVLGGGVICCGSGSGSDLRVPVLEEPLQHSKQNETDTQTYYSFKKNEPEGYTINQSRTAPEP
jgi:hypothetical protein